MKRGGSEQGKNRRQCRVRTKEVGVLWVEGSGKELAGQDRGVSE